MGGGSVGGEADHGRDGADVGEDDEHWPGLESLPPTPPVEWGPARPWRRRRHAEPVAALPPPGTVPPAGGVAPGPGAPPPSRWPVVAVLVAAVLVLLLVPTVILLGRDDADELSAATTTTTTSTTAPTTTTSDPDAEPPPTSSSTTTSTLPPLVVTPDPLLDAAIAEGSAFVAAQRGLDFGEPVPAVRLPDAEFEARIREQLLEVPGAIEAQGNLLKLQGVIGPDVDYVELFLRTYPTLVGARFYPDTKMIVARGEPGTPVSEDLQELLAHELTHALDHHAFDLYDRVYDDPSTEQQFGLNALVEGDAVRIQQAWAEARGRVSPDPTVDTGDVVRSQFSVTYVLGLALVDEIVASGGETALDVAFDDPPTTSEQVLHPEKYLAREPLVPLAEPPADGTILWSGVTGEYTTGQMLRAAVSPDSADAAAAGWGNDKGVIWIQQPSEGGLTCLRIAYAMDTPTDLDELEEAFLWWAASGVNRAVGRQGDTLIVQSCEDVPPPPGGSRL